MTSVLFMNSLLLSQGVTNAHNVLNMLDTVHGQPCKMWKTVKRDTQLSDDET